MQLKKNLPHLVLFASALLSSLSANLIPDFNAGEKILLLLRLEIPVILFFAALYFLFRPQISAEKKALAFVSLSTLHIFTYFTTFFGIIKVYGISPYLPYLVGTLLSVTSALIAAFILQKICFLSLNLKNVFIGALIAWLLANGAYTILDKLVLGKDSFYALNSIYFFWQCVIGYECLRNNVCAFNKEPET